MVKVKIKIKVKLKVKLKVKIKVKVKVKFKVILTLKVYKLEYFQYQWANFMIFKCIQFKSYVI